MSEVEVYVIDQSGDRVGTIAPPCGAVCVPASPCPCGASRQPAGACSLCDAYPWDPPPEVTP